MKKFLTCILVLTMLTVTAPKPAEALVIDVASIASKVSDWVGKITDMTSKITQQVSQIKQMATQGFSKEGLLNFAKGYLKDVGKNLASQAKNKLLEDTKAKEKAKLESDKSMHTETATAFYDEQTNIVNENISEVNSQLNQAKSELNSKKRERDSKKSAYEKMKERGTLEEIEKAFNKYNTLEGIVNELELEVKNLEGIKDDYEEQKDKLSEEKSKIGTAEDKDYARIENKIEAMRDTGEKIDFNVDVDGEEWDAVDMEKFSTDKEVYTQFIKKYFYDASNINGDTKENQIVQSQAEMERVMRARRQLIVDQAAQLLQLTASIRRNIPTRSAKVKEMFDGVTSTDSELQAIGYYSGTKIENMKALLLYAKLQTARLQYMAVKDLSTLTPYRNIYSGSNEDEIEGIDLQRYMLTSEEVNAIKEEKSKTVDLFEGAK